MKLENITKRYGDKFALHDVSLTFEEGKIAAVLGESGAGKTTLLNVIADMIPFEGTREDFPPVSYLFQEDKLLPGLTVEKNLRLVLAREKWSEIGPMLVRVGLGGKEKRYPNSLSGGERRRVAIARAFLYPHGLLVMDEPFSSLDLSLKKSLIELVASLQRERGDTVVFVTHDVREAVLLSHRALVLREGKIVADIPVAGTPPRDFFLSYPEQQRLILALMGRQGE